MLNFEASSCKMTIFTTIDIQAARKGFIFFKFVQSLTTLVIMHFCTKLSTITSFIITQKVLSMSTGCPFYANKRQLWLQCKNCWGRFLQFVTRHPPPTHSEGLLSFNEWALPSLGGSKRGQSESKIPVLSKKRSSNLQLETWFQSLQNFFGFFLLFWADMEKPHRAFSKRLQWIPWDFENLLAGLSLKELPYHWVDRYQGGLV